MTKDANASSPPVPTLILYEAQAAAKGTSYEQEVQSFIDAWGIPANKFGDPDDFGAMVAIFCSEQASYVTGQSLVVDGGITNATF